MAIEHSSFGEAEVTLEFRSITVYSALRTDFPNYCFGLMSFSLHEVFSPASVPFPVWSHPILSRLSSNSALPRISKHWAYIKGKALWSVTLLTRNFTLSWSQHLYCQGFQTAYPCAVPISKKQWKRAAPLNSSDHWCSYWLCGGHSDTSLFQLHLVSNQIYLLMITWACSAFTHTHMHANTQVLCDVKMAHDLDTGFNFTKLPMVLNFELRCTRDGILLKHTWP